MPLNILASASLQDHNTMAVPATADHLVTVQSIEDLHAALDFAQKKDLPFLTLGAGSNVLFTQDYAGLVILNRLHGVEVLANFPETVLVKVASGENWHDFVGLSIRQGWHGLENLALIPGLVGAAPIQNIGAYGAEIKDTLVSLEYLHIGSRELVSLQREQCQFGYRDSIFKHALAAEAIVVSVTFELSKTAALNLNYPALKNYLAGQPEPTAQQVYAAVCAIRKSKLPLPAQIPNAGSFFKNPVVNSEKHQQLKIAFPKLVSYPLGENYKLAAAWMIEHAGWKDKTIEHVSLHQLQALVVTNPQCVSGGSVMRFAQAIQDDMAIQFGVELEVEPRVI